MSGGSWARATKHVSKIQIKQKRTQSRASSIGSTDRKGEKLEGTPSRVASIYSSSHHRLAITKRNLVARASCAVEAVFVGNSSIAVGEDVGELLLSSDTPRSGPPTGSVSGASGGSSRGAGVKAEVPVARRRRFQEERFEARRTSRGWVASGDTVEFQGGLHASAGRSVPFLFLVHVRRRARNSRSC